MTDKREAVRLAKFYGLKDFPEGVERVLISNHGRDACEAIVTRQEYDAVAPSRLSPGESVVFDRFGVVRLPELRVMELEMAPGQRRRLLVKDGTA